MNFKILLLVIFIFFFNINIFAQIQNPTSKNKHAIGIGILPLAETIFIPNAILLKANYTYFLKPKLTLLLTGSFFKRGKESYDKILGIGSVGKFNIIGGQLKFGFRKIYLKEKFSKIKVYNIFGLEAAFSQYQINHQVFLKGLYDNNYFDNKIDLYSLNIELQYGKAIKFTDNFNIATYISFGIVNRNEDKLPMKGIPGISNFNEGLIEPYLNFTIDLFYNLKK